MWFWTEVTLFKSRWVLGINGLRYDSRVGASPCTSGGQEVNLNAYGSSEKMDTYRRMSNKEKNEFYDDALEKLRLQISKSKAFTTEELRDDYLKLFDKTIFDYKDVEIGTPALADYEAGQITLYKGAMEIQTRNGRDAPRSLTVKRMAKVLTHELRHLTGVNHQLPSSSRSLFSSGAHDRDPRENDANKFEQNLWRRTPGTIQDF